MASFDPGQILAGKYRIERVLGQGGMGVVLAATHVELETHVAVKVLSREGGVSTDDVGRFLREAQAASRLRSEFVARVTDFGRLHDEQPFMVMELLDGEDFEAILRRGPLPVTAAVDAVLQAAAGLAEAHAGGIIHRDVKPSNLFRTSRPDGSLCVKVLDFGISKIADPLGTQAITRTGHTLGTPLYMSPEQLRSPKDVDARTDVWSLGVVLHEMLTGASPFLADELTVVVARILEMAPPDVRQVRREVPEELAAIAARCLEKQRDGRVASMGELAELLAPFASVEGGWAARRAGVLGTIAAPSLADPRRSSAPEVAHAETLHAGETLVSEAPRSAARTAPVRLDAAKAPRARWMLAAAVVIAASVVAWLAGGDAAPTAIEEAREPAPPASGAEAAPGVTSAAPSGVTVTPMLADGPDASDCAAQGNCPVAEVAPKASAAAAPPGAKPRATPRATAKATSPVAPHASSNTLW